MKKVLLLRFSSLGDVVLTSSLIEPLTEDGYKPYLLTYKPYGELFGDDTRLKTFEVEREELKSYSGFKKLLRRLRRENFYTLLDLHSNLKSFFIRKFLKTPKVSVYKKRSLRRRACVFLNRFGLAENLKNSDWNVLKAYAETLKVLEIEVQNPKPKILISKGRAEDLIKKYNLGDYVVLGIGARYRKKRYPHFEKLAKELSKHFQVVLIGDKRDYELSKGWKGVLNLCGKLSLKESLYILSGARLYIGNDSGSTHMARAVGVPVLAIYGGTHPCLGFAPSEDEGKVITKNLNCSPCNIHGKGLCKRNYECLEIPPQIILEETFKMVSR